MRKVYLTVTTRTMVPVIAKVNIIAVVDEGVSMDRVAKAAIVGTDKGVTVEDTSIESWHVDKAEDEAQDADEQIIDYLTSEDSIVRIAHIEVTDSK